jgi:hypothetical protein
MLEARFTVLFLARLHSEMKLYEVRLQVIALREDSTLFSLRLVRWEVVGGHIGPIPLQWHG